MTKGFARAEGTERFRGRFPELRDADHFRHPHNVPIAGDLWLSSIGLGTYLGEPDAATDSRYTEAVREALRCGINLLDTAINYRHQRSERNIGSAVGQAIAAQEIQRDEIFVCTKAGFLTFDGAMPPDPRAYFVKEYLDAGVIKPSDLAAGMHCMAPAYLENQLERSRKNLQLETIDLFYLHNPETQLAELTRDQFAGRLQAAFEFLESSVQAGKVRFYGTATWNGYRLAPNHGEYLSLEEIVSIAQQAGGQNHHFRFIQLPFNLGLTEAFTFKNQPVNGEMLSTLEAAQRLGIAVVSSATLYQGQLTHNLPAFLKEHLGGASDPENAIQFSRSAPGLTTALIGMGRKEHVAANMSAARRHPATPENWQALFSRK